MDIRQRLRMLADNAQRSEIVEDAIRLIDRLEGRGNMYLPIKVLSRDEVEIEGSLWYRENITAHTKGKNYLAAMLASQILRMMDEFEEPPTWEPGTVVFENPDYKYRLDKHLDAEYEHIGMAKWKCTELFGSGSQAERYFCISEHKIHRLPHEFKVGDWFETEGVVRQMIAFANKRGWIEAHDGMIYDPICCRHVPPPKEQPAYKDLPNNQAAFLHREPILMKDGSATDGIISKPMPELAHRAVEKEAMPNDDDRTIQPVDSPTSAVTGGSPSGNQTSERFSGPHWKPIGFGPDADSLYLAVRRLYARVNDLREAWLEKEGK